jgi:signal transduction histidine kinase/putative methionine-R-sulfoxide reductase with GAF domain
MQFFPDTYPTQTDAAEHSAEHSAQSQVAMQSPSRDVLIEALLNALPAQVALLDRYGTIMMVNDAWNDLARHVSTASLAEGGVGTDYLALRRQSSAPSHEGAREVEAGIRAVLDGKQPLFTTRYSSTLSDASDERRWFLFQVRALSPGAGGALLWHLDITTLEMTERKLAEMLAQPQVAQAALDGERPGAGLQQTSAAERANETQLHAMQALTDSALSYLAVEDLLHELLGGVQAVMGVDNVAILLLDDAGETLTIQAARGPEEEVVGQVKIPLGQGFAGRIAATRKPLIVDDLSTFDVASQFLREKLHSVAGVPLLVDSRLVGVVHVGSVTLRHFTQESVQLLQIAADHIALAIDRARLYEAERDARARAEEALARANQSEAHATERAEQLRTILETIADGIAVTDKDGRIIQANRAYRELFAMDGESEIESVPPSERRFAIQVRGAEGKQLRSEQFPETRALRGEVVQGTSEDFRVRARDGREVEVNTSAAPLRGSRGSIEGAVLVARDVTWRKRLERESEEAHANELASQETTRHMDEFLATASHDLRAPLTVAVGTIDLAATRFDRLTSELSRVTALQEPNVAEKVARVRVSLEESSRSLDRLSQLVEALFDLSKARSGALQLRLQPSDLGTVVSEHVAAARVANPNREICLMKRDENPLRVLADPGRIGEVVTNYLTNALKYSAEGQPVVVRVSTDGPMARVSVRDRGPGLPSDEHERIWQPFYRAQSVQEWNQLNVGLGMGLYISKSIVEAHGGQVGVSSAVGVGSTFWFALPLDAERD